MKINKPNFNTNKYSTLYINKEIALGIKASSRFGGLNLFGTEFINL